MINPFISFLHNIPSFGDHFANWFSQHYVAIAELTGVVLFLLFIKFILGWKK